MGTIIQFILIVIVTSILWSTYHKIFNIVYVNSGKRIVKELAACFCLAVLIIGILGNVFFAILPYLMVVVVVIIVILIIRKIMQKK